MTRQAFMVLLCVFMLLPVLGSCGNPAGSANPDTGTERQDPAGQEPSGSTSDQSDPEDEEEIEDPEDGDDSEDAEDPDQGEGSGAADQPGGGASENGSGQGSDGGSGDGSDPGGDGALTGSAAVQAYLDGLEDNTPATPYLIKVGGIDLAVNAVGNTLRGLYLALSRFVILDLSGSYGEKFANVTPKTAQNKNRITEIILPAGLYTVNINAFAGCENLVSADLREVITVNNGAFQGCTKLETLIMEEVTKIVDAATTGKGTFEGCISLVSVSLPKVTDIGIRAFNSCESLSTVHAPLATAIGDEAFANCANLQHIVLGETPPALGKSVFAEGKPEFIYVPVSAVNTYKNTDSTGWTDALKAKVQAIP